MSLFPELPGHIDLLRPETLEELDKGEWHNLRLLFNFAGANIYTPLDRYGRNLPAYVMANDDLFLPADIKGFVHNFCRHSILNVWPLLKEDKLGLNAIDYACFSQHTIDAVEFLKFAITLASIQDHPLPLPNFERLMAVTFSFEITHRLDNAELILKTLPYELMDVRHEIMIRLGRNDKHAELTKKGLVAPSLERISERFNSIIPKWSTLTSPEDYDVKCAPQSVERMLDVSETNPAHQKRIRDALVAHVNNKHRAAPVY